MDWRKKANLYWDRLERFIRFVINHFIEDDCTYRASALAFTTLLAIVPLMTVGFSILSSFPVFHNFTGPVQDFIFENFVPATGKAIQNYIHDFSAQVSKLSIWGVAFLFVTAILVMVTIERAMNKIWRVSNARKGVAAFLLYWAILSLGPIFLGLSLAASSYLISIPFLKNQQTPSFIVSMLPFLLSLIGFTFLYVIVPNRPIQFWHGFIGGLFATILFESAKQAFAFYLSNYDTYQLLYGAFAIVPIFFVWVYWVWFITLLGAEVSYALSVHHKRRSGKPIDPFSHALLWLQLLWLKQKEGQGLCLDELIQASTQPYEIDSDHMITELQKINLVHTGIDGRYLLSRNLNEISLYWLSKHLPYNLPDQYDFEGSTTTLPWEDIFKENDKLLQQSLSISLSELFSSGTPTNKNIVVINQSENR
ncbi:YihY family inner membrane protein [Legionella gresilensis]|uniref:YihY family inner membrane protein n=1 Tax=Legionella gresilensis TaxID=91823 RepID=UPI00104168E8|nr:YihY family inner membrane protein [Legionella gresilensis]